MKCVSCSKFYHKKCSEFRSKPGQWTEPTGWSYSGCKKVVTLDPTAYTFIPSTLNHPIVKGKHKKSTLNEQNPTVEFLQATINTLKSTIAKNELELKKWKESNDLKLKRIVQLEAEVEEAKHIITKHKCESLVEKSCHHIYESAATLASSASEESSSKLSNIESRTSTLEKSISLLAAKFESFQAVASSTSQPIPETLNQLKFVCEICDDEFSEKNQLLNHKAKNHTDTQYHSDYLPLYDKTEQIEKTFEVYACDKCEFTTQHENTLIEHKRSSHQSTRYFYSSTRHLNRKNQKSKTSTDFRISRDTNKMSSEYNTNETSNSKQHAHDFQCLTCKNTFQHKDEMALHIQYYHEHDSARKE